MLCKAEGQETRTVRVRLPTSDWQPRHMRMRVLVCLHMQKNGLLYLIPTPYSFSLMYTSSMSAVAHTYSGGWRMVDGEPRLCQSPAASRPPQRNGSP